MGRRRGDYESIYDLRREAEATAQGMQSCSGDRTVENIEEDNECHDDN